MHDDIRGINMQQRNSTTKQRDQDRVPQLPTQAVKSNRIALTQADLDRGLSAEQIHWLLTNLNVKAMSDVLRKPPDPDEQARSA